MIRLTPLFFAAVAALAACSAGEDNLVPAPTVAAPDGDVIEAVAPTPVATLAPPPTPTPTPVPGALTVTDTDVTGVQGDEVLSLVEAVGVANGKLELAELSGAEQALITGEPGRDVPDTIVVDVPGDQLFAPGGNVWLVEMFGNEGDVIDGDKVQIIPSADDGESRNVLLVGSADIVIRGFVFMGVEAAIAVESAGKQLTDVRIQDNAFIDTTFEDVVVRSSIPDGGFQNLAIVNNTFAATEAQNDVHRFVTVFGGVAPGGTGQINGTAIDGLQISGNSMSASAGAAATCITIHGGVIELRTEGTATNTTVANVSMTGNLISGCDTGIEINGGTTLQQNGSASGNVVRGVSIVDSTLSGTGSGLVIRGGHAAQVVDFGATPESMMVTGNAVEDIQISDSTFSGFEFGIELLGGVSDTDTGGMVSGNRVGVLATDGVTFDGVGTPCVEAIDQGPTASGNELTASCAALGATTG